jgi:hypothetical protein
MKLGMGKLGGVLAGIGILILAIAYFTFAYGYLYEYAYYWFLTPTIPGLPVLSSKAFVAISLMQSIVLRIGVAEQQKIKKSYLEERDPVVAIISAIVTPWFFLGLLYIVKLILF